MKIRILDNSIRYRLTRSEVAALWKQGRIEAQTSFIESPLVYAIEQYEKPQLTVAYRNNRITLYISREMTDALQHTEKVGFEDKNGPVSILIEKDFVCLDNPAEDQSDHYPNPNSQC